jgi:hypothetical protein
MSATRFMKVLPVVATGRMIWGANRRVELFSPAHVHPRVLHEDCKGGRCADKRRAIRVSTGCGRSPNRACERAEHGFVVTHLLTPVNATFWVQYFLARTTIEALTPAEVSSPFFNCGQRVATQTPME